MRAAVYHGRGDLRVENVTIPDPAAGELLLEVHSAGVCGTDAAEFTKGPMMFPIDEPHLVTGHMGPLVPGHEFGGRVVAIGAEVEAFDIGQLVACGAGISCGTCALCRAGRTSLCVRYATVGLQRNGGLARYCAVPASVCLEVGSLGLTDDGAALVQPMSIAVHAMRRGGPEPGSDVVVIGVGGVGAFLVFALHQTGAHVVAVDLDPDRLSIAANLGASAVVQASVEEPLATTLRHHSVEPAIVYEVSGSTAGLSGALDTATPGGRVVTVGLHETPQQVDVRALTLRELEVVGTNAHVFAADVPEAARLVAAREDPWDDVAPVALPLEDLVESGLLPLADRRSTRIKSLFDPSATTARPTVWGAR